MSKGLEKVIKENGLVYHLAEDGCYYPDLKMEQKTDYPIGKYGIMRAEYMMEHQRYRYLKMAMEGSWNEYLHEVDEECRREVKLAEERIKRKEGLTENMKNNNPMEWVRRVNGIKERVEENVLKEIMYSNNSNEWCEQMFRMALKKDTIYSIIKNKFIGR